MAQLWPVSLGRNRRWQASDTGALEKTPFEGVRMPATLTLHSSFGIVASRSLPACSPASSAGLARIWALMPRGVRGLGALAAAAAASIGLVRLAPPPVIAPAVTPVTLEELDRQYAYIRSEIPGDTPPGFSL